MENDNNEVMILGDKSFYAWNTPYNDGSKGVVDKYSGLKVLHVKSLPSLIQAIGYSKYIANQGMADVYFRGQSKLYKTDGIGKGKYLLQASALRGVQDCEKVKERIFKVDDTVARVRKVLRGWKGFHNCRDAEAEGILQQYGISTSWLDVVDNIWVALWFACFKNDKAAMKAVRDDERVFYHMVPRDPRKDGKYAYVVLMRAVRQGCAPTDGMPQIEVIDLRKTLPSMFVRPHMQHGLLIRPADRLQSNMADMVCGIIRMDLRDSLKWMGEGLSLKAESMVPPPNYDFGFKCLLAIEPEIKGLKFPIYC